MEKISSLSFFKAWYKAVHNRKPHLSQIWRNAREFTAKVKGNESSIMQEVANELNLKCYHNDYYFIDTVLYKEEDLVPNRPVNSYWFRDIRVAFEHENSFRSGLFQEVSHLIITNCDLRVLVTYPNSDEEAEKELKYLHDIIKGNRQSKVISQEESFLIIFGIETNFLWEGYVFKEDSWKDLTSI